MFFHRLAVCTIFKDDHKYDEYFEEKNNIQNLIKQMEHRTEDNE